MKKLLCLVLAVLMTAGVMAGCDEKKDDKKEKTTSASASGNDKRVEKIISTDSENSSRNEDSNPKDEESSSDESSDIKENNSAEKLMEVFKGADRVTGLVANSEDEVDAMITAVDPSILESFSIDGVQKNISDGSNKLYKFKIDLTEGKVEEYNGSYVLVFNFEGQNCLLMLGHSDSCTLSEANFYAAEGLTVEYWGVAAEQDSVIAVVPMVAGCEGMGGYWFVRPALEKIGFDVSDMEHKELNDSSDQSSEDDYDSDYEDDVSSDEDIDPVISDDETDSYDWESDRNGWIDDDQDE